MSEDDYVLVKKKQGDDLGPIAAVLLIVVVVLGVFVVSPGLLLVAIARFSLDLDLDQGQMWTFAILVCCVFWGFVWAKTKNLKLTAKIYFVTSGAISIICLVLHFGLKVSLIRVFLGYFFG
jgi:hypothetical protein